MSVQATEEKTSKQVSQTPADVKLAPSNPENEYWAYLGVGQTGKPTGYEIYAEVGGLRAKTLGSKYEQIKLKKEIDDLEDEKREKAKAWGLVMQGINFGATVAGGPGGSGSSGGGVSV